MASASFSLCSCDSLFASLSCLCIFSQPCSFLLTPHLLLRKRPWPLYHSACLHVFFFCYILSYSLLLLFFLLFTYSPISFLGYKFVGSHMLGFVYFLLFLQRGNLLWHLLFFLFFSVISVYHMFFGPFFFFLPFSICHSVYICFRPPPLFFSLSSGSIHVFRLL